MDDSRTKALSKQLTDPCFIEQPADLLYLTGMELSKGRLLATPKGATLFVDGRYYEQAKRKAPCPVLLWDEQKKLTEKRLGFDSAALSYEGYIALKKTFPHTELLPMPNPVKHLRAIKDTAEIGALKKAQHLTSLGIQKMHELLREGITEQELGLEFEMFCRKNGASGLSFEPIIAFGENSAYPHHRAGKARLQSGQVVLVDMGVIVDQYHGDMTRIFHFGKPHPRIVELEHLVRTAQKKAIDQIKPGIKLGKLDQIVRDEFDRYNVKQLYMHSLGHGIGLETHEFPRLKFDGEDLDVVLQMGMIFTIEPGLYQPGVGGVRIEDVILVTETGHLEIRDA